MKSWALAGVLAAAAAAGAADYAVDGLTESATARVRAVVEKPAAEFAMPAWAPGDYQIFDYGEKVLSLSAKLRGEPVAAVKAGANRWTFPQGADEVDYIVSESGGNFSPNLRVRPGEIFISGPGVFGAFAGDEMNWQRLTRVTLDGVPTQPVVALPWDGAGAWIARDYDHFIDSPIAASSLMRLLQFEAGGKPHEVAIYGRIAPGAVPEPFDPVIRPIVEQTKAIFGELAPSTTPSPRRLRPFGGWKA
jgi:predicted metalloprotease with PDZ domain